MPTITNPIRILLISGHTIVRAGLRLLIDSRPELTVAGEATNCSEALSIAPGSLDVILLELDLNLNNNHSGLDLLPELLAAIKGARALILTNERNVEAHQRAMRLGAMGLVFKERPPEDLFKAIEKVHAGEVWLDRSMMARVLYDMSRAREAQKADPEAAKIATLTEREREIIALVGEGFKNKQIAERLLISETTVRHHLTSIFDKLNVSDRCQLVVYAYRHELAELPTL